MKNKIPFILFVSALFLHLMAIPFARITYDESAYSMTALTLVKEQGWLQLYGKRDLFFFPPLFNYFSAFLVAAGLDRLLAVRCISALFSAAILPLLYMVMVRSGATLRAALIACAYWLVLPWAFYFSVIGQVETAMLAAMMASAYYAVRAVQEKAQKFSVYTALFLAAALWIKESSLGMAGAVVVLFAIYRMWRHIGLFLLVFTGAAFPLFIQSLMPNNYDLFFEITTPLILWNNISLNEVMQNFVKLHGVLPERAGGFYLTVLFFLCGIAVLAGIASVKKGLQERHDLILFVLLLIIYVPFFVIFPKKFTYYMLPVALFAAPFIGEYLARRVWLAVFFGAVLIFCAVPEYRYLFSRIDENDYRDAFAAAVSQTQKPRIAAPLPRKMEYIAERDKAEVIIVPTEWMDCIGKVPECVLPHDYFIVDDYFLRMLFCRGWPMDSTTCDDKAKDEFLARLELIKSYSDFRLYRIRR